jgi:hypothetical protein
MFGPRLDELAALMWIGFRTEGEATSQPRANADKVLEKFNEVVQKPLNHRGRPGGDSFKSAERHAYVAQSLRD